MESASNTSESPLPHERSTTNPWQCVTYEEEGRKEEQLELRTRAKLAVAFCESPDPCDRTGSRGSATPDKVASTQSRGGWNSQKMKLIAYIETMY